MDASVDEHLCTHTSWKRDQDFVGRYVCFNVVFGFRVLVFGFGLGFWSGFWSLFLCSVFVFMAFGFMVSPSSAARRCGTLRQEAEADSVKPCVS